MFLARSQSRPAANTYAPFAEATLASRVTQERPFQMTLASIGPYSTSSARRIACVGAITMPAARRPSSTRARYSLHAGGAGSRWTARHHEQTHECATTIAGARHAKAP